jgi:hypothetical protein
MVHRPPRVAYRKYKCRISRISPGQSSYAFTSLKCNVINVLNYEKLNILCIVQEKGFVCNSNNMREQFSKCPLTQPCYIVGLIAWLNKLPITPRYRDFNLVLGHIMILVIYI